MCKFCIKANDERRPIGTGSFKLNSIYGSPAVRGTSMNLFCTFGDRGVEYPPGLKGGFSAIAHKSKVTDQMH